MATTSESDGDNGAASGNVVDVEEELMLVDATPLTVSSPINDESRLGEPAIQLDALLQSINLEKMEHRAMKFGLVEDEDVSARQKVVKGVSQSELKSLYKSLDIDLKDVSAISRSGKIRLDTIHMRGVNEMNTDDIFDYFKGYSPATVEWVNDHSCNILWMDNVGPARALVILSQPIKRSERHATEITKRTSTDGVAQVPVEPSETEEGEDVEMSDHDTTSASHVRHCSSSSIDSDVHQRSRQNSAEQTNTLAPNNSPVDAGQTDLDSDVESSTTTCPSIDASTIEIPVPPGPWRLGVAHPKAKWLLLRYALKSDRKIQGAEKLSQYYIRYGNPNYQGLKGIISTSLKRKIKDVHYRPKGYVDLDAVGGCNEADVWDVGNEYDERVDFKDVDPIYDAKQKELLKRPRMRMYADDEENKPKKSAALIQQSNLGRGDLRNRIGCDKFTVATSVATGSYACDQRSSDGPDLRCRLSSTRDSSRYGSSDVVSMSSSGGSSARDLSRPSVIGDLRSKLEKLRQSRQPKVPLLIEIAHDDI